MQPADACPLCRGTRVLPNWMDAPGGPRCACGRKSVRESGACMLGHPPIPCPRCGEESLQVARGVGLELGRPPFAGADRPFCKCGWAIPGPISADVRGEILSLRMQCPYCGTWISSNQPKENRDKFRVVGGTEAQPSGPAPDEPYARHPLDPPGVPWPGVPDDAATTVERKLRLVKPEDPE